MKRLEKQDLKMGPAMILKLAIDELRSKNIDNDFIKDFINQATSKGAYYLLDYINAIFESLNFID